MVSNALWSVSCSGRKPKRVALASAFSSGSPFRRKWRYQRLPVSAPSRSQTYNGKFVSSATMRLNCSARSLVRTPGATSRLTYCSPRFSNWRRAALLSSPDAQVQNGAVAL